MNAMSHAQVFAVLVQEQPPSATGRAGLDPRIARGLAVHRDTVRHALVEALRETFPAVRVGVGDDYFDALAMAFIAARPPTSPVLQEYGDAFAGFIVDFVPLQDWPWLQDLARIDWARREAYYAADAEPLSIQALQAVAVEHLLAARFVLHPSLRLLQAQHPLASLWFAHVDIDARDVDFDLAWHPEACQVWRIDERVHIRQVSDQTLVALRGLLAGKRLLSAMQEAFDGVPDPVAIKHLLHQLFEDRLLVAIHPLKTE